MDILLGRHATWTDHKKFMEIRPGMWDSNRIGAGATPIKTDKGWLEVYHGVDDDKHYQLGIVYLDLNDPAKVIARSRTPILKPELDFEKVGLVSNVVFTCGMVRNGRPVSGLLRRRRQHHRRSHGPRRGV